MRFLCLYRPGKAESDAPPTGEEMAAMGKLIGDMSQAGVLLGFEGCLPTKHGVRVNIDGSKFSITDGPFPETKELIAARADRRTRGASVAAGLSPAAQRARRPIVQAGSLRRGASRARARRLAGAQRPGSRAAFGAGGPLLPLALLFSVALEV